jgi:glucuronoarabinoxylan endo-1,4-beta-xylanase
MSQFAKFIRPGYHRVYCPNYSQHNVYITAYKNDSGKVVIVVLNMNTSSVYQTITITNGSMTAFTPFTTTKSKNCEQSSDRAVTNGSLTVTLEPSSITTFVSN